MSEIENEIIIKSCYLNEDYLKEISELFGNKNARDIILLLIENEMYVNEIAIKLDLRVSLIVYHLKKLGELGFLSITEKPISRRTKNHKYFTINLSALTILLRKKDEDAKKDASFLKKIFKERVKITTIGVAGLTTWIGTNIIDISPTNRVDSFSFNSALIFSILTTGVVVSLIIIYYLKKRKLKKN